jgi:hypothetical protein
MDNEGIKYDPDQDINIPISMLHVKEVEPEYLVLYAWLSYLADPEYEVNYKPLSILTGIPIKKISRGIAYLENKSLIIVDRTIKAKPSIIVGYVPVATANKYLERMREVDNANSIKNINNSLLNK